mgnify:CR=1 FL=1
MNVQRQRQDLVLQADGGIKWVHSSLSPDTNGNPEDSTLSANIVEAAKRVFKKPVRKKQPISTKVVEKICERFASPPCTLKNLRTSLMFSLGFPVYLEPTSYLHLLKQVISKLRRTIFKFWFENQRQTGIIKETQYTLQKLTGQHTHILCSCVFTLLQVSNHDQKRTSPSHSPLWQQTEWRKEIDLSDTQAIEKSTKTH